MTTSALMAVLGGVGLFLLGMRLMTDGLRMAAGNALRHILASWTRTPLRGLATGFGITAAVQSSSAVTVAVIGFANAGLLTLDDTLWVIYGSNVGTSITGWLVALVGFKINLKALALPFIGIGMGLNISGHGGSRRAAIGEALAGFGLFFMGVDILKEGFTGMEGSLDPASMQAEGLVCVAIFVAVGLLLTILMQSSSATMAMLITASAGGAIPITCAAAAVVGANVGTTATAALAVI